MIKGLLGEKIGMMRIFSQKGDNVPVTVIQLGPSQVIQKKTLEKDGYEAVQIGYKELSANKAKKMSRPLQGNFKQTKTYRHCREFKAENIAELKIGQTFDVTAFEEGALVDVSGISKGKGFTGVMKRHNFAGGPDSHGHRFHRSTGSIGASATPSRVLKNRKMPGRHGFQRITVQGLRVMQIHPDDHLILVKGAIPGPNGSLVEVRKSIKAT